MRLPRAHRSAVCRQVVPAGLAAIVLSATSRLGTDYPWDAGPAISSLAHSDVHRFVLDEAQMGPLSLLLRAPFAALAGADSIWGYRLGSLACLLAVVGLGVLISRYAGMAYAAIAAMLLMVNPVSIDALRLGHPEERIGASLCVMALVLARERQLLAAITLGAALATKQWALIAVAPVLLAAPRGTRLRLGLIAAGVAAVIVLPLALLAPDAFIDSLHRPVLGVAEMRSGNLWGVAGVAHHVSLGGGESVVTHLVPGWLRIGAHALIMLVGLGLGTAALCSRRRIEPLALLAALMLLRCALDPWDHAYYHLPFLTALVGWEVLELRRAPLVSALSALYLGVVFGLSLPLSDALYAVWAVPMLAWLGRRALGSRPLVAPRALRANGARAAANGIMRRAQQRSGRGVPASAESRAIQAAASK